MVQCFMIHPTGRWRRNLRRYRSSSLGSCSGKMSYHNADGPLLDIIECMQDADLRYQGTEEGAPPKDDPRWPVKCDSCDYQFTDEDPCQIFSDHIYVDDSGKEYSLRNPVPGMMRFADWMGDWMKGPDGHCLVVVLPDGWEWSIDGPASNCTMPEDRGAYGTAHRCWTRTGTPPLISVGKEYGKTCGAGAGSIQSNRSYHGFLGINGAPPGVFT